jgi:hypothetical protein
VEVNQVLPVYHAGPRAHIIGGAPADDIFREWTVASHQRIISSGMERFVGAFDRGAEYMQCMRASVRGMHRLAIDRDPSRPIMMDRRRSLLEKRLLIPVCKAH